MSKKSMITIVLTLLLCFIVFLFFQTSNIFIEDSLKESPTTITAIPASSNHTEEELNLSKENTDKDNISPKKNIKNNQELARENENKKSSELPINNKSNYLKIIVKNEAGDLLENTKITLLEGFTEEVFLTTSTNKEGESDIIIHKMPKLFSSLQLVVRHDDYAIKKIDKFKLNRFKFNQPLVIILHKGNTINGIAKDEEGNLLNGITIFLKNANDIDLNFQKNELSAPTCVTNNDGAFEFLNITPSKILFKSFGQKYYLLDKKTYQVPSQQEITLTFRKAREYTLKVVDQHGVGVSKAKIWYRVDQSKYPNSYVSETNSKGICVLFLKNERLKHLAIQHPKFANYDTGDLFNSKNTEPEIVVLSKGKTLTVKLIDINSRQPLKCAYLYLTNLNGGDYMDSLQKENGDIEFSGLVDNEYSIKGESSGFEYFIKPIFLDNNHEDMNITIELKPLKFKLIKIIDAESKLPPINKDVLYYKRLQSKQQMTTNEKGEISLQLSNNSDSSYISLEIDGYANIYQRISSSNETLMIEATKGTKLQVFLTDPSGKPLDELLFFCYYDESSSMANAPLNSVYNSSSQCFEVFGLLIGKVTLNFKTSTSLALSQELDLKSGDGNTIKINLLPLPLIICKINSLDGRKDFSELNGIIKFYSGKNDSNGTERILKYNYEHKYFEAIIDYGDYDSFAITISQYLPSSKIFIKTSPSGISEYDFLLTPGLGIEGQITDTNGNSIADAKIAIIQVDQKTNGTTMAFDTDSLYDFDLSYEKAVNLDREGKFSTHGYSSGKYLVKVSHFDYCYFEKEIELTNKSIIDLQIILKKGSQISGTVISYTGEAASNASMSLLFQNPTSVTTKGASALLDMFTGKTNSNSSSSLLDNVKKYSSNTRSNFQGEFSFVNVVPGNYTMIVNSDAGNLENYEIVVSEGVNTNGLTIRLNKPLEIAGVITDENEIPLEGVYIYLNPIEGLLINNYQRSDENGGFKFINVQLNQKYKISINSNSSYKLEQPITLTSGDENVKIKVKSPTRKLIKGKVFNPDGKSNSNFSLSYLNLKNNQQEYFLEYKITTLGFEVYADLDEAQNIAIIANASGYTASKSDPINLLQYTDQIINITLTIKITLEFKITDKNTGLPISGAKAILFEKNNTSNLLSNENGILHLKDEITIGKNKFIFSAADYASTFVEFEVSERNTSFNITLGKGSKVKGQLIDKSDKTIPFVTVKLISIQTNQFTELTSIADENGNFKIQLIPPGNYYLTTDSPSRIQPKGLFHGILVTIEEGKDTNITRDDLIAYTKTKKINITLTGADVAKKEIKLSKVKTDGKLEGIDFIVLSSDQEGKAQFTDIPLGEYIISVDGTAKPISQSIVVNEDTEINLEIPIE